jgi:hypothetical protein
LARDLQCHNNPKLFCGALFGQVNHRPADFFSRQIGGAARQDYEYPPHIAAESRRNPENFGLPNRCSRRRFHFDSRLEYLS